MIAIGNLVYEKYPEIVAEASESEVYSAQTAQVTGIPLDIVNKALENLEDDGAIFIESKDDVEE